MAKTATATKTNTNTKTRPIPIPKTTPTATGYDDKRCVAVAAQSQSQLASPSTSWLWPSRAAAAECLRNGKRYLSTSVQGELSSCSVCFCFYLLAIIFGLDCFCRVLLHPKIKGPRNILETFSSFRERERERESFRCSPSGLVSYA